MEFGNTGVPGIGWIILATVCFPLCLLCLGKEDMRKREKTERTVPAGEKIWECWRQIVTIP